MKSKKFDRKNFQLEIITVINKYSDHGNQFTNAEIVASLTSIFVATLKQAISDKKAGKYLMTQMIDEAFENYN